MKLRLTALLTTVVLGVAMVPGTASAGLTYPSGRWVAGKAGTGGFRTIDLPNKSDMKLDVITAVDRYSDGRVYGSIQVSWESAGLGSGHKFDGFQVVARLERRNSSGGTDVIIKDDFCDVKTYLNRSSRGILICYSDPGLWNSGYYWSGDGYLQWDVDNDGKGWLSPWHVHGSPLLS